MGILGRNKTGVNMSEETRNRTPPHDNEIEKAVLCNMLNDGLGLPCYKDIEPDDFYSRAHSRIFKVLQYLYGEGVKFEPLAVITELKKIDSLEFEAVGGETYIKSLFDYLPSNTNREYYVIQFLDYADRRRMLYILSKLNKTVKDEAQDLQAAMKIIMKEANFPESITPSWGIRSSRLKAV
jgi:replicative DNA helicase